MKTTIIFLLAFFWFFVNTTLAYVLCFEDTTLGGYLPFLVLSIAPIWGGLVASILVK